MKLTLYPALALRCSAATSRAFSVAPPLPSRTHTHTHTHTQPSRVLWSSRCIRLWRSDVLQPPAGRSVWPRRCPAGHTHTHTHSRLECCEAHAVSGSGAQVFCSHQEGVQCGPAAAQPDTHTHTHTHTEPSRVLWSSRCIRLWRSGVLQPPAGHSVWPRRCPAGREGQERSAVEHPLGEHPASDAPPALKHTKTSWDSPTPVHVS